MRYDLPKKLSSTRNTINRNLKVLKMIVIMPSASNTAKATFSRK